MNGSETTAREAAGGDPLVVRTAREQRPLNPRVAELTVELAVRPALTRLRAAVAEQLSIGAGPYDRLGAVLLVVDELAENAYRHPSRPGCLRVTRAGEDVMIEVSDDDPDVRRVVPGGFGSGRFGLRLVDDLTLTWGVRDGPAGKIVWALVPLTIHPGPASG